MLPEASAIFFGGTTVVVGHLSQPFSTYKSKVYYLATRRRNIWNVSIIVVAPYSLAMQPDSASGKTEKKDIVVYTAGSTASMKSNRCRVDPKAKRNEGEKHQLMRRRRSFTDNIDRLQPPAVNWLWAFGLLWNSGNCRRSDDYFAASRECQGGAGGGTRWYAPCPRFIGTVAAVARPMNRTLSDCA